MKSTHFFLTLIFSLSLAGCSGKDDPSTEERETEENTTVLEDKENMNDSSLPPPAYHQSVFDPNQPCHWLVLFRGATEAHYQSDRVTLGSPGHFTEGAVILYMNGSPMGVYTEGVNWRIQEYLQPGKNTIEVKGKHSEPIMISVHTSDFSDDLAGNFILNAGFDETIDKVFIPEDESGILEFTVKGIPPNPIPNIPQEGVEREKAEQELRALMVQYQDLLDAHDGVGYARIIFKDRQKMAEAWNITIDDRRVQPDLTRAISLPSIEYMTDLRKSEFVWGQKLVLVWSSKLGLNRFEERCVPSSVEMYIHDNSTEFDDYNVFGPLIFGRLDGEWVRFE